MDGPYKQRLYTREEIRVRFVKKEWADGMIEAAKRTSDHIPDATKMVQALAEAHGMLCELRECSEYWSEYDVPLGIKDRLELAVKKCEEVLNK